MSRSASDSTLHAKSFCRYCKHRNEILCINYSNTTKNNVLFIDVLASRRTPSSGLTSSAGRQYVKAYPEVSPDKGFRREAKTSINSMLFLVVLG